MSVHRNRSSIDGDGRGRAWHSLWCCVDVDVYGLDVLQMCTSWLRITQAAFRSNSPLRLINIEMGGFWFAIFLAAIVAATLIVSILFAFVLLSVREHRCAASTLISQDTHPQCSKPAHLLVVLGSGGHTAEMLLMLEQTSLDEKLYAHRTYVVSSGDAFSASQAAAFERRREPPHSQLDAYADSPAYTIVTVPRARRVHQSLLTAPLSTLLCLAACTAVVLGRHPAQAQGRKGGINLGVPDMVLANGPATAVCVAIAAKGVQLAGRLRHGGRRALSVLPGLSGLSPALSESAVHHLHPSPDRSHTSTPRTRTRPRVVFVESWARVSSISLSGRLLLPVVDRFLVQWPDLAGYSILGGKAEFVGMLL